jgi:hypothetical protein
LSLQPSLVELTFESSFVKPKLSGYEFPAISKWQNVSGQLITKPSKKITE